MDQRKLKILGDKWKWKKKSKFMGHNKSSAKGEFYSYKHIKWERSQINDLTLELKELERKKKLNWKLPERRKETIKIRA